MQALMMICEAKKSDEYQKDNSNEGFDSMVPMDLVGFSWVAKAADNLILLS